MATFNLIRNSRVSVTTNVGVGTGVIPATGFTAVNTQELTVLDGFSFSQGTNQDTVTVAEAGSAPTRGQRSFNTSLNPVEFSFSTYVRPYLSTTVKTDDDELWNALFGTSPLGTASVTLGGTTPGTPTYAAATGILTIPAASGLATTLVVGEVVHVQGITGIVGANLFNAPARVLVDTATSIQLQYLTAPPATTFTAANVPSTVVFQRTSWVEHAAVAGDTGFTTVYSEVTSGKSNSNQLVPFGLIVTVDNITYLIDNCALDQAQIDFGLDGIATIQWTGKGTALRQVAAVTYAAPSAGTMAVTGGVAGTFTAKTTTARYITNKLSTVSLVGNIGGGGTSYNVALTGGSLTIANNISYVTPTNLGVVNQPIGYYTGTRAITGTLNAYLRTGTGNTADLLNTLLSGSSTATETKFALGISVGGSSQATRMDIYIPGASVQIPTIDAQAVISTAISFTAEGTDFVQGASAGYDLENTNDIRIRYFSN